MTGSAAGITAYGQALAAALNGLFALYLVLAGHERSAPARARALFVAAIAATATWAALSIYAGASNLVAPTFVAAAFDVLRYGLWLAFLLFLLKPAAGAAPEARWLRPAVAVVVAAAAAELAYRAWAGLYEQDDSRLSLAVAMALPLAGMVLVEQLFRNLAADSLWSAKPLCLGLAVVFVFDLYLYSEALLFGRFDPDALSIRGAVPALAVPLLYVATRRSPDWARRLQVSRIAAFHSATLLLAGGYLLFMSAVGYYVRYFGGAWGRALQLALLTAGLAGLGLLVLSGSMRSRVRVFVGKHFFRYHYDYREEWLRFTAMLASKSSPQEVGQLVVHGLADMIESTAGGLWTRTGSDTHYRLSARWNLPPSDAREDAQSGFCAFLREQGWVIDVDEYREAPRRYGSLALPQWLLDQPRLWLVVPLLSGDELLGFVTLARPRAPMVLNWEVRDLLKTASRQAAGFLAQMHATEALLEARKFDAFNRMSAFVVHDLKNIVTQLSLMMKNAQRLRDNPEFQQDMLLTVESSLEKMRRLMLQLREGAAPPGSSGGVELEPIARRLAARAAARGRTLEVECAAGLATRGHDDRLERVLGHLVDNALDATPAAGRVWLNAARASGQVKVEVGDTGVGMSEEFVQNKLFRPFSSTKANGMGIGTFESFQYVRELGGTVAVDTRPGQGTVITVLLPVFEARTESDLHEPARP